MIFSTYRTFFHEEELAVVTKALEEIEIPFEVTTERAILDSSFGDAQFQLKFHLKISKNHFLKVDELVLELAKKDIDEVGKDHYLFSFTDTELVEILARPDEWSELDFLLAQKILRERGFGFEEATINRHRTSTLHSLAERNESLHNLVFLGYGLAMLGGIFGVLIGLYLTTSKKTVNGRKSFKYSPFERQHGRYIVLSGMVDFVIVVIKLNSIV